MGEQKEKKYSLGPTHAAGRSLEGTSAGKGWKVLKHFSDSWWATQRCTEDVSSQQDPSYQACGQRLLEGRMVHWAPDLLMKVSKFLRMKTAQSSVTIIMTSHAPQESCSTSHDHFWYVKGRRRSLHSSSWSCLEPHRGLSWSFQADITKYFGLGDLNNINVFLSVLEARKSKIKTPEASVTLFLVCRWLPSCCDPGVKGKMNSLVSLIRTVMLYNKGPYSQSYGFFSSHVQVWELGHKED